MENLGFGLQITVIGMVTVVVSLGGLALIIKLLERIFHEKPDKRQNNSMRSQSKERTNEVTVNNQKEAKKITAKKIAAISGAISAYLDAEQGEFVITSIKSASINWSLSGRQRLLAQQSNVAKSKKVSSIKLRRKNKLKNYNAGGVLKNA